MRKDIHPDDYRLVVFKDMSNDYAFICPSCAPTKEKIEWEDGNEYPVIRLDISSDSHPFYTGRQKFAAADGRVERFNKKFGLKSNNN